MSFRTPKELFEPLFQADLAQGISKRRTFIMGIAMLSVVAYHMGYFPEGYLGVDIFLFLSGFGIFHSLAKKHADNHIESTGSFYLRRLKRILPTAIAAGIPIAIINYYSDNILRYDTVYPHGWDYVVWCCGLHLWYIRCILALYFLSPLAFYLIRLKRPGYLHLFILAAYEIFCYYLLQTELPICHETSFGLALPRTPTFFLGMFVAAYPELFTWRRVGIIGCLSIALGIGLRAQHVRLLYIMMAFAPGAVLTSAVLAAVKECTPHMVIKAVEFFGRFSLEIYVVHEAVINSFGRTIGKNLSTMGAAFILSAAIAYGLHQLVAYTMKMLSREERC